MINEIAQENVESLLKWFDILFDNKNVVREENHQSKISHVTNLFKNDDLVATRTITHEGTRFNFH